MNSINDFLKNPRYAFLAALISRPAGLLIFSIWIAHRWRMADIALFESFSVFQFLIFFAWLPAWGTVSLMQASREGEQLQKSFLFSNVFFGWLLLSVCYFIFSIFWSSLLPGISIHSNWITVYIILSFYYFLQIYIYKNYLEENTNVQWVLSLAYFISWIVFGLLINDFETYLRYQVITQALFLVVLKRGKIQRITIQWKFWKQVMVYSLYTITGGLGPILAAYFVQARFGLGNELNWFRYGTRELPILPAWLSGFGQSFLKEKLDDGIQLPLLKKGVSRQISLLILPLSLMIVFCQPLFSLLFGNQFLRAADLMSIFLLIYIPRMIFSQVLLQAREESKSLLYIGLSELIFMIVAAIVFVPTFGLEALVWILVAGTVLEKIIQVAYLWFKGNIPLKEYLPITTFLVFALSLLTAFWIKF